MPFAPPRTEAERLDWLRLTRSEGIGPLAFAKLAETLPTPAAALDALPGLRTRTGARAFRPAGVEAVEAEMAAAARAGARLICLGEPDYPAQLAAIADPPPALWALGEPALTARPCVAVVGARNASAAGMRFAGDLARDLGAAGWVVVSGLARGIDAAAHAAALETGTVAVQAGGVDVIYPPQNAGLAERIASAGLRLSEAPMGEQPTARSFPRRNRIVSGLSRGVALVEAAERSGSLITARLANEQGREVMAAPGSPADPRSSGCNALIRDGATLIRGAADALEALGPAERERPRLRISRPIAAMAPLVVEAAADRPAAPADRVAALLGSAPISSDELARAAGLTAAELAEALADLELDGRIDRRPGDLIALT